MTATTIVDNVTVFKLSKLLEKEVQYIKVKRWAKKLELEIIVEEHAYDNGDRGLLTYRLGRRTIDNTFHCIYLAYGPDELISILEKLTFNRDTCQYKLNTSN